MFTLFLLFLLLFKSSSSLKCKKNCTKNANTKGEKEAYCLFLIFYWHFQFPIWNMQSIVNMCWNMNDVIKNYNTFWPLFIITCEKVFGYKKAFFQNRFSE